MDVRSPLFQNIACILMGVMFLNPIVSTAAELTVDAAAGGNTNLSSAQNGVPVVNIATPNGSGLSHNKFTDYNVGQQGLILNNGTAKFNETQLGGVILGNSNLNGRAANLILNEITGGNQSQLKGYTEVAGQGAHVVVANPHGITCDGCGFINTPRATLTTGTPVIDNGRLDRFDVNGGQIDIEGAGLNASNISQFDLITRSAKLNAQLQAQQLNIVVGRNDVDATTLAATAKVDDGSTKPTLAIDSSALGGMYAGAIRLVGTESGVGVKLAGDMAASGGDIHIDANGKLTVARVASNAGVQATAKEIELTDTVYAANSAALTADQIDVASSLASGANLTLTSATINNNGTIEAGVKPDGTGNSAALLDLQGGTLNNNGSISSQGSLNTDLQQLNNSGKKILSVGNATVKATTINNSAGQLVSQKALTVTGDNLNNSAGTVASNKALSLTLADTLNNSTDGLLLNKAEGLTLNAQTLNNVGGTVQADNGALTVISSSTDNSNGTLQADSLEITATNTLTNDSGRIAATQGQQTISAGTVSNIAGTVLAKSTLKTTASSFDNSNGTLGADHIDLGLTGALNNDGGLVESSTTLLLNAGSLTNNGGKLRALGASGTSEFVLGGLFNNDRGLVEIGNSQFSLSSGSLSNQSGIVRHVGTQGFALALADVGSAGGSFITNGELNLNVADWTNSSLLQAQKISLNVGTFTQTSTGKLRSTDSITAIGDTWINDGSIETDGALDLTLTGAYSGNGSLLSRGDLTVNVASVSTGVDAEWKAGGQADFTVGGNLVNRGKITAAQSLIARADSVSNYGTLGAATTLRVEADSLLNEDGLLFSGSDMALRIDSFTNRLATLYSLGGLNIAANDHGDAATLVENRSGTIESSGDMSIRATTINNVRDVLNISQGKYSARIAELQCSRYYGAGDCDGKRNGVWEIEEFDRLAVSADSTAASFLTAGGKLELRGDTLSNQSSSISAGGDLTVQVNDLQNTGVETGEVRTYRVFRSERTENIGSWQREADQFTAAYWSKPSVDSNSLTSALNHFIGRMEWENTAFRSINPIPSGDQSYSGIIQAGGNVAITAQASFDSTTVSPTFAYVAGGYLVDTTVGGSNIATTVSINPQLPPDTTQQPVTLPGITLPQGQNGLFHVNTDTSHPYLVETNPAFATLRGFLSSDYLLGIIGYNQDLTQRRLGDGLYEQRLVQQAVVARTGKRFLDGLTSDEAQFKYLMDNAIASKDALNLVPGVALSAEQVAALTHDIVWMQEQEVDGQKVLVPVLYLAQATDRVAPTGALIQGRDVTLITGSELNNGGTLRASNNLVVSAQQNIINSGLMQANESLSLVAGNSIRNIQGGILKGQDVKVVAVAGDVINERTISTHKSTTKNTDRLSSFVDSAATIEAGNDLLITAGRDIQNTGGAISVGRNTSLEAGDYLLIGSAEAENHQNRRDSKGHSYQSSITQYGSEIRIGGDLDANAGRDLLIVGSKVQAEGDIKLSAAGDVNIAAAANQDNYDYKRKGGGKKIVAEGQHVQQVASNVEAGRKLDIVTDGNLTLDSSNLKVGGEAYLYAGDQIALLANQNIDYSLYDKKKKGDWASKKTLRDETTKVRNIGSSITTGGNLTLQSAGDQLYQNARLESNGDLTLDSAGAITFETVKDLDQESHEKSKGSWAWNSADGEGTTDESIRQSVLIAKGATLISAVEGINIDVRVVNQETVSQAIDAMVAADPEMAWLKEAEMRGDIDWRRVKELHDSWDYDHSGLGGVAMVVIAIIVTYLTWGAGSSMVGVAANSATGMAANAVVSAVAVNATTSTINNRGNLGAVIKDITSSDAMKGYVVSGVTAGFGLGINVETLGLNASSLSQVAQSTAITAGIKTAVYGGSLKDNLKEAAISNAVTIAGALGAHEIGKLELKTGSIEKIALHAALGGLLSEAMGGDFRSGAIAAGADEAMLGWLGEQMLPGGTQSGSPEFQEGMRKLLAVSQLVGALAAGLSGGDAQVGATVAANATANNYLRDTDVEALVKELDGCDSSTGPSCASIRKKYEEISAQNTERMLHCKENNNCPEIEQEILNGATAIANVSDRYASVFLEQYGFGSQQVEDRISVEQKLSELAVEKANEAALKDQQRHAKALAEASPETLQSMANEEATKNLIANKQVDLETAAENLQAAMNADELDGAAPNRELSDAFAKVGQIASAIGDAIEPSAWDILSPATKLLKLGKLEELLSSIKAIDKAKLGEKATKELENVERLAAELDALGKGWQPSTDDLKPFLLNAQNKLTEAVKEANKTIGNTANGIQNINRNKEITELFSYSGTRSGIQIGDRSLIELPNTGNAKIFAGATDVEVKQYFSELTKSASLPAPRTIPGKGEIYVVSTPEGSFTLRNFSTSSGKTGPAWTIDIPKAATGTTYNPEIKFLVGTP